MKIILTQEEIRYSITLRTSKYMAALRVVSIAHNSFYSPFLSAGAVPVICKKIAKRENAQRWGQVVLNDIRLSSSAAEMEFVSWLTTQKNNAGDLFKPNIASRYAYRLRRDPMKLDISLSETERNVFNCRTVQEFNTLNQIFCNAPNYQEVNRGADHGAFSAGLTAYRKYMQYLEENGEAEIFAEKQDANSLRTDNRTSAVNGDIQDLPKNIEGPKSSAAVPDILFDTLAKNYPSGFRFETTYINLLSSAAGIRVDEGILASLKAAMFHRNDDVFFLLDQVADKDTRKSIMESSSAFLQAYGCFELPEFYQLYREKINPTCIRNVDDFECFYEQIAHSGVRCVRAPHIGNRIARHSNGNVWAVFGEVAVKIVAIINSKYYGSCTEDDLHREFCVFSKDLLGKIIKACAASELIRVEINGSICYQSFEAFGLPEDFSEVLSAILERLDEIELEPSQEVLHTAISLHLGLNFKSEFSLPDWESYRRLVATYYKGGPRREWKNNVFGEVVD